jgi:hypothetical protein
MKRKIRNAVAIITISVLSVGLHSFANSTSADSLETTLEESVAYACRFDQCRATAKSTGQRCRHCVSNYGDVYCYQHK